MKKNTFKAMLIMSSVLIVGAILTLVPSPIESKDCFLRYSAMCPYSPISTGIMLFSGLMIYSKRKSKIKRLLEAKK